MGNQTEKKSAHPLNEADIIYMIMTDRYPDGDTNNNGVWGVDYRPGQLKYRQGGDFQGIINRINYLKDLGITAIWISPPQKNEFRNKHYEGTAYHGYHTQDYFSIDEHFGSEEKLKELIDVAHAHNIKVILDAVPNHTADYLDPHATEYNPAYPRNFRPAPPFDNPNWYHHNGDTIHWDNQWELENTDIGGLDDLAHEQREVKEALFQAYSKLVEMGFDGIRIDAATSIPKWFLREFEENAGVPTFGETYHKEVSYVCDYQKYIWGVLDFPLFFAIVDVFASDQDFNALQQVLALDYMYEDPRRLVTFLDNHDRNRFLCVAEDNYRKLFLGMDFIFTARGIPDIYYGTEQGFYNGGSNGVMVTNSIIDWQNREVMDTFDEDNLVFKHIKRLAYIRKTNPVLSYGQQQELYCSSMVYAFARRIYSTEEIIISVFNNSYDNKTMNIPLSDIPSLKAGDILINLLNTACKVQIKEGIQNNKYIEVSAEGKSALILKSGTTEEYIPEKLIETRIIVHYNGAPSDRISLRGNSYPLWENRDREMRKIDGTTWEFLIYRICKSEELLFKPILNGMCSTDGEYTIKGGTVLEVFPDFKQQAAVKF